MTCSSLQDLVTMGLWTADTPSEEEGMEKTVDSYVVRSQPQSSVCSSALTNCMWLQEMLGYNKMEEVIGEKLHMCGYEEVIIHAVWILQGSSTLLLVTPHPCSISKANKLIGP